MPINVRSHHSSLISGVGRGLNWREVKGKLSDAVGCQVLFVETFEAKAWPEARSRAHVLVEFEQAVGPKQLRHMYNHQRQELAQLFNAPTEVIINDMIDLSLHEFFSDVRRLTGVDLLASGGRPPLPSRARGGVQKPHSGQRGPITSRQTNQPTAFPPLHPLLSLEQDHEAVFRTLLGGRGGVPDVSPQLAGSRGCGGAQRERVVTRSASRLASGSQAALPAPQPADCPRAPPPPVRRPAPNPSPDPSAGKSTQSVEVRGERLSLIEQLAGDESLVADEEIVSAAHRSGRLPLPSPSTILELYRQSSLASAASKCLVEQVFYASVQLYTLRNTHGEGENTTTALATRESHIPESSVTLRDGSSFNFYAINLERVAETVHMEVTDSVNGILEFIDQFYRRCIEELAGRSETSQVKRLTVVSDSGKYRGEYIPIPSDTANAITSFAMNLEARWARDQGHNTTNNTTRRESSAWDKHFGLLQKVMRELRRA